jgi:membrane protein YdbS with pleckstrin-like domain
MGKKAAKKTTKKTVKKTAKKTAKKTVKKTTAKKPPSKLDTEPFEMHEEETAKYILWKYSLAITGLGALCGFGVGAVFGPLYALLIGSWLAPQQAQALKYWLEESGLHVNQGVYFLKRKTIPYDKITDLVLSQGPLLRALGLWQINVETAGSNQQRSEAVLLGVKNPEEVKAKIIEAREAFRR